MLIFVDFEASSLLPDSWPIEIGLAWITPGGEIVSHGRLIRPHPSWPDDAWSEESAVVHGIPRTDLDDADPAEKIARWAIEKTRDACLLSDAPAFDQRWMTVLLAAVPDARARRVRDFDAAAWATFNRGGGSISPAYREVCAALERRNP